MPFSGIQPLITHIIDSMRSGTSESSHIQVNSVENCCGLESVVRTPPMPSSPITHCSGRCAVGVNCGHSRLTGSARDQRAIMLN